MTTMTTRSRTHPDRRPPGRAAAFTLLELMIALALVLVLLLGVNEVFRLTSQTISAGQALSQATRDQGAAQQQFASDMGAVAADAPFLIITNRAVGAFRSAEDKATNAGLLDKATGSVDLSADPTFQDLDGDNRASRPGDANYVPGEMCSPAIPNSRIHRIDTITMFVRRNLQRATGNVGGGNGFQGNPPNTVAEYSDLLSDAQANEAMVTYGHLRIPNNSFGSRGTAGGGPDYFFDPGEPDDTNSVPNVRNDNNIYASQWYLGCSRMLLAPTLPSPKTGSAPSAQNPGTTAFFPDMPNGSSLTTDVAEQAKLLTPLSMRSCIVGYAPSGTTIDPNSSSYDPGTNPYNRHPQGYSVSTVGYSTSSATTTPWESKLDLAVGSIGYMSRRFAQYRQLNPDPDPTVTYLYPQVNWPWFMPAVSDHRNGTNFYDPNVTGPKTTFSYRASAVPFAARGGSVPDPLGQTLAQTSPILLPRVSQFIVEYAGDFISQDNNQYDALGQPNKTWGDALGYPQGAQPDGQIDYVVFRGQKRIRWYGLPRYTGSGNITTSGTYVGPVVKGIANRVTPSNSTLGATNDTSNNMPDVVPLSDILTYIGSTAGSHVTNPAARQVAPFERIVMAKFLTTTAACRNSTLTWLSPQANYADPTTSPGLTTANANYVCAWAGGGPKMIRITIVLEDANPKNNAGGRSYEYIYNLPY